jgi:hypothetical protein
MSGLEQCFDKMADSVEGRRLGRQEDKEGVTSEQGMAEDRTSRHPPNPVQFDNDKVS